MVESADFDGTNDYMTRGAALTGVSNSKSGILSFWVRIDGSVSTSQYSVLGSLTSQRFYCVRFTSASSNFVGISGYNSSGTSILGLQTSTAYTNSATWRHFLFSWDLASTAGHLYVNDSDDLNSGLNVLTNDSVDYASETNWQIGASGISAGSNKFDGCIAELYFAPGQYLDFSVTNNRRRFITSSLKPVYLGKDGAGPTGTAPLVYLHLDPSEALTNFATNRGTGGDFSITGTLTAGSSSPSDF